MSNNIVDRLFDSEKVHKLETNYQTVKSKDFSRIQKCALLKAAMYVISADNVITKEEKDFFLKLATELNADKSMIKEASELTDDNMFKELKEINTEEDGYVIACLNNAAFADNCLAQEEDELLNKFKEFIPKGVKPTEFYNKIINL